MYVHMPIRVELKLGILQGSPALQCRASPCWERRWWTVFPVQHLCL